MNDNNGADARPQTGGLDSQAHRLDLRRWIGSAPDDGLTTEQALQKLRLRPVPWIGTPPPSTEMPKV